MTLADPDDPGGLIREAYRIEGITKSECRSIFLDWALKLPMGADTSAVISRLLAQHAPPDQPHPMTEVLTEGLTTVTTPRRRGGWRSRLRN